MHAHFFSLQRQVSFTSQPETKLNIFTNVTRVLKWLLCNSHYGFKVFAVEACFTSRACLHTPVYFCNTRATVQRNTCLEQQEEKLEWPHTLTAVRFCGRYIRVGQLEAVPTQTSTSSICKLQSIQKSRKQSYTPGTITH